MFMSEYHHSLDTKGRLIIPTRFREQLGSNFILSKGMEHCLCIYPKEEWKKLTDKLCASPSITNSKIRRLNRFFFTGSVECEPDKQGRILIPPSLRAYASLEKEVIVAGVGSRIEIWDREAWEEYNTFDDIEELAGSLEDLQL
ncbi:MAG TPA: division/cell wall cluster transcriptional repressor MraZ [Candidatus Fimimorpha faecalis]|uniref:Transcriptional regulator MraZ n=1 Tax=Candidatus Fimimorpha faecalis TaxID=2840824 RepID=A0A9D1JE34_9FIRM|nr:division/cell wall cluster transcriptional repressor MraZ [Candidatus Fimimorpha faecalis]